MKRAFLLAALLAALLALLAAPRGAVNSQI